MAARHSADEIYRKFLNTVTSRQQSVSQSRYKQKQAVLEAQILEIDKLNSSIKIIEKEMLDLKVRFEEVTNERNKVGVQLIERNDELIVLHEKANQQLEGLKNGKLEIRK